MFTNKQNMALPLRSWGEETVDGMETTKSLEQKTFQMQQSVKKVILTVLLEPSLMI